MRDGADPPSEQPRPASIAADDFSTLFEFLPVGAYRSTPEGRQLRANPALVKLNGYESEAHQLEAVRDIGGEWYVDPGRRAEFKRLLERDGRVIGFESEVYRMWPKKTPQDRVWVSENAHLVRGADGRVLFYEGTVEEITERVRDREELHASRERLRQIVDLVPGMMYRVVVMPDGERRITFVSPGVRNLYGLSPEDVLADGRLLNSLRHPDDAGWVAAASARALQAREPLTSEFRILPRNVPAGEERWVQAISAPAPDEQGGQVRVGVIFDITDRKRTEEALRESGELWKRALESTGDGMWDWDRATGGDSFSEPLRQLYGYTHDELPDNIGALDRLTHPDDIPEMARAREAHFAGRTPVYINEHRILCKDGSWKWVLSRGFVISREADGTPRRMVGTHTDITAEKQAEALRIERDRAAAADVAKSQFLSRVSHELRTPLNAILGFAQLLELEPGSGERQRSWVQHVISSGRHLLALMNDILDISSAQSGELRISAEAVALRPALDEVLAMVAGMAGDNGVALLDDLPPASSLMLRADRRRFKQVVSNLLSNAIKYNRRGGWVRVGARAVAGTVELSITDSGIGMNEAQLAQLFQPFERLGAQRGPIAGTGLGLAVSRQLAEAMGGSIGVQSEPGKGSTFRLRLPSA